MNNARYLRELDFARFHFYDRLGIYAAVLKRKGGAVQGACTIRYRRAIPIFTLYKITTKVTIDILHCISISFFSLTIIKSILIFVCILTAYLLGR